MNLDNPKPAQKLRRAAEHAVFQKAVPREVVEPLIGVRASRCRVAFVWTLLSVFCSVPFSESVQAGSPYSVGIKQVEYIIETDRDRRPMAMTLFYPATINKRSAKPFVMPFFINLHLDKDAEIASNGRAHPLIVLSHGRGSNGLLYAWFAEALASHGYIVAALNHYHANSYDAKIEYLTSKIWQRPVDVGLTITYLLNDAFWGKYIDADRIGVAGHSQGGFTALWVGGAKVNPEKFLAFQRRWRNDQTVPEYLRREMPVDAAPALNVQDKRVKAVFAMAPGVVQAFGMDESGLKQLAVPTYITVGAGDTVTPPKDNAEFAAKHVPHAELYVIPGPIGHNIYVNECDEEGKAELTEACVDDPSVDRGRIHALISDTVLKFFNSSLTVSHRD